MPGLENREPSGPLFDHPSWRRSRARRAHWRPLLKNGIVWCAHVWCVAWLHGALGALSPSVEEGRSIFGVMAGFWAKF